MREYDLITSIGKKSPSQVLVVGCWLLVVGCGLWVVAGCLMLDAG
jgi:hypothetical protein